MIQAANTLAIMWLVQIGTSLIIGNLWLAAVGAIGLGVTLAIGSRHERT